MSLGFSGIQPTTPGLYSFMELIGNIWDLVGFNGI